MTYTQGDLIRNGTIRNGQAIFNRFLVFVSQNLRNETRLGAVKPFGED